MDRRRLIQPTDHRPIQPSHMMRYRPYPEPDSSSLHLMDPSKDKLSAQMAEIEQLSVDRRTLSLGHVELKEELNAAHKEIEKLRKKINETTTESDIERRVLLDKIAKMEVEIRACQSVEKELQQAKMVAIQLVKDKQELNARVEQATEELEKAHVGLKSLSEKHEELHSLRQEHHRLHSNFEYERAKNLEEIVQLQVMEKTLLSMSKEAENLRAAISNAERSSKELSSRVITNTQPLPLYQPPIHTNGAYVGIYGRPYTEVVVAANAEGTVPYGSRYSEAAYGYGG